MTTPARMDGKCSSRCSSTELESEELRLATFALVDGAFQQRRKMLRQSLSTVMGDSAQATAVLTAAGIDPTERGEQLTVHDFLTIARAWLAA
jgi:16S rRNA (adenine1518-N6/adenine1519-N6)-dimethyltransferase